MRKIVSLRIDQDVYKKMKILAVESQKNYNELLEEAMHIALHKNCVEKEQRSRRCVTSYIDDDLYLKIKKKAIQLDVNVNNLIEASLETLLTNYKKNEKE